LAQAAHNPVTLGDADAECPMHADRVHLVEIGYGAIALREIADGVDRRDVAVHGIDAFEADDVRPRAGGLQQLVQMRAALWRKMVLSQRACRMPVGAPSPLCW
jgi:hypothetical protein